MRPRNWHEAVREGVAGEGGAVEHQEERRGGAAKRAQEQGQPNPAGPVVLCAYVSMCVYVHVCIFMYIYMCIDTYAHICTCPRAPACTQNSTGMRTWTETRMLAHTVRWSGHV